MAAEVTAYADALGTPVSRALLGEVDLTAAPVRGAVGRSLSALPPSAWNRLASLLPGTRAGHFGSKVQKGFRTMGAASSLEDVFVSFLDEWHGEPSPVLGAGGGVGGFDLDIFDAAGPVPAPDATRMMYADSVAYLPDDILCKVDRAAMSVSLETRVPFLDLRVAAVAARIPAAMNIHGGQCKMVLRALLYRDAPSALFERPKAGFAIPVGDWLRGPLRPWAEDLLEPGRLRV